jgi:hypothetical protein
VAVIRELKTISTRTSHMCVLSCSFSRRRLRLNEYLTIPVVFLTILLLANISMSASLRQSSILSVVS